MVNKILLTGASGFLGTNILLKLIDRNNKIFALGNKNKIQVKNDKIYPLYSSLENMEGLKYEIPNQLDCVIHCAALTKSVNIDDFYIVNTYGTRKLLDFFVKNKIEIGHFIHISSISAIGPQLGPKPADEFSLPNPIKGYGESKLLAEEEVKKKLQSKRWTIMRPPFIFGPYDYDTLNLFKVIKKGFKVYIGNKHFSFVYSEDLVDAIIKLMCKPQTFAQVYFFAYNKWTNQREFLNTIAKYANPSAKYIRLHPTFLIWIATLLSPFLHKNTSINRIKFKEIKQNYWICSSEKIKNDLNLVANTSLNCAVEKTYNWYRNNRLI